jgi:hypothetical protein
MKKSEEFHPLRSTASHIDMFIVIQCFVFVFLPVLYALFYFLANLCLTKRRPSSSSFFFNKVGFIREKGKAISREAQWSLEAGSLLHR